MSLGDDLMVILSSYHGGYRLMRRRMRGDTRPVFPRHIHMRSAATLQVTLSRLKKRGLTMNERGLWFITKKGVEYVRRRMPWMRRFAKQGKRETEKNMIIAFDIPERKKKERDWLRVVLVDLGFSMLQKSVWFGSAPLPKEFVASLEELKILEYMKFFKAEERDIV